MSRVRRGRGVGLFEDPEVVVVVRGAVRRDVRPWDGEEERLEDGLARMVCVVGIWELEERAKEWKVGAR